MMKFAQNFWRVSAVYTSIFFVLAGLVWGLKRILNNE